MNKHLQTALQTFDRKALEQDKRQVDLVWKMFHGIDVRRSLAMLDQEKAQLINQSGYLSLIEEYFPLSKGLDQRELALRKNKFLIEAIRSIPEVAEAQQMAGQAQYAFRVRVGDCEFNEQEVAAILNMCEDPILRNAVWHAQEQSIELAPYKYNLMQTLNHASKLVCDKISFAEVLLGIQDSSPTKLKAMILEFEKRTKQKMESLISQIAQLAGVSKLSPMDFQFALTTYLSCIPEDILPKNGNHALKLFKQTLATMGFSQIKGKKYLDPEQIDKSPFIFSLRGGEGYAPEDCALWAGAGAADYRVFMNPQLSQTGVDFTRTLFLEGGRLIHYQALDRLNTRMAFKYDSDCMRHGLAMLFDSITEDEKWLRDIAGIETKEAESLAQILKTRKLTMARNLAADALFEIKLYAKEEPADAYQEVQELFTGSKIEYDIGKRWAWHPYLAYNPGGQLSYVLGHLIYEIISEDMKADLGGSLLHPKAAERLVDKYFTGYEKPWSERIPKQIGE